MVVEDLRLIENIVSLKIEELQNGIFLCLFGTDKIPPHLGLIADGKYYSTSAKGNRVGENTGLILRKVNQSEIPTLFVKLAIEIDVEKLKISFTNYPKLKETETCLLPIKDYINSIGIDVSKANFVYELIPLLKQLNLTKASHSLYINQNVYELSIYTKEAIANRIVNLQETC